MRLILILRLFRLGVLVFTASLLGTSAVSAAEGDPPNGLAVPPPTENAIRIATFNVSLFRKKTGELSADLQKGSQQAERLGKIIRNVNPDIILLNEIDSDQSEGSTTSNEKSVTLFRELYLEKDDGKTVSPWPYVYSPTVNTGVDSGLDLDNNDRKKTPNDCWGYGEYPGQYGLAVLSRFPIKEKETRTFQNFLWRNMPHAMIPRNVDGTVYWKEETWNQIRLSSKTHADVVIDVHGKSLHLLVSHPTPPVFDGPEDRNGCRNNDEIRFWKDYVEWNSKYPGQTGYHIDDNGIKGSLKEEDCFAILGDLNADPIDGSGIHDGILGLINSARVNNQMVPKSAGAVEATKLQGRKNSSHKGDPATDTGDFNDGNAGNLRCDFVLPSANLTIKASGVFWPNSADLTSEDKELIDATDHRMVWVDVVFPNN